jgi:23S rRNA (pseudouridine1915-N3)-methyltransferase
MVLPVRIQILMVGKIKEKHFTLGIQEYLKRLGPYARVELTTVPNEPTPDGAPPALEAQIKEREGEKLLKQIDPGAYVIALDGRGVNPTSEEFAAFLAERALQGQSNLVFVIGGSLGLAPAVLKRADHTLSLGRMTFIHQMVPMILLEQIYRGYRINRGEPYHK